MTSLSFYLFLELSCYLMYLYCYFIYLVAGFSFTQIFVLVFIFVMFCLDYLFCCACTFLNMKTEIRKLQKQKSTWYYICCLRKGIPYCSVAILLNACAWKYNIFSKCWIYLENRSLAIQLTITTIHHQILIMQLMKNAQQNKTPTDT